MRGLSYEHNIGRALLRGFAWLDCSTWLGSDGSWLGKGIEKRNNREQSRRSRNTWPNSALPQTQIRYRATDPAP